MNKVCDGRNDCGDALPGSDESNCTTNICPSSKFRCNSGHCKLNYQNLERCWLFLFLFKGINMDWYCDEDLDCPGLFF